MYDESLVDSQVVALKNPPRDKLAVFSWTPAGHRGICGAQAGPADAETRWSMNCTMEMK